MRVLYKMRSRLIWFYSSLHFIAPVLSSACTFDVPSAFSVGTDAGGYELTVSNTNLGNSYINQAITSNNGCD